MYAIGGSANPTILSEGNFYVAPNDPSAKQVEIVAPNDPTIGSCAPNYSPSQSLSVAPSIHERPNTPNRPETLRSRFGFVLDQNGELVLIHDQS
ncbi:unnamed protein product [Sphenostylis stenocarpa]|uniref:Uncharacterized protein n=1 Tax=Sphenostylis stenocarpa TaxID=92480 RepID=A0AA86SB34_9FABA|nr:unnamed protein product [Sphenostylis stenocarpa]